MAQRSASTTPEPAVLAIGAHPDDIEFYMAGTLLLLGRAGYALPLTAIFASNWPRESVLSEPESGIESGPNLSPENSKNICEIKVLRLFT